MKLHGSGGPYDRGIDIQVDLLDICDLIVLGRVDFRFCSNSHFYTMQKHKDLQTSICIFVY